MKHRGTTGLETLRLQLRRAVPADAEAIYRIFSDEQVVNFLRVLRYESIDRANEFMSAVEKSYASPDYYFWVVTENQSGALIGTCGLFGRNEADEVAEVAYVLARPYWGRGYATEALKAVLSFGLREVGFNRIEAVHSVGNPASGAVMRSAGMLYEGMSREKYKNHLGYHDAHTYAILKKDLD